MNEEDAASLKAMGIDPVLIRPDQYVLMRTTQDTEAAYRWNVLNEIRKEKISTKGKIIKYLRKNVGKQVTGEELSYLAKNAKEWARRVVYVLEEDRQAYVHDRKIPDPVRVAVLKRDNFRCVKCGWSRDNLRPDDPRKMLELHHKQQHKDGGENTVDNLITLCNVCHDEIHRR